LVMAGDQTAKGLTCNVATSMDPPPLSRGVRVVMPRDRCPHLSGLMGKEPMSFGP
jgi:hypothetical protein